MLLWIRSSVQGLDIKLFNLLSCPGCAAQEFQAGFDGWVAFEAVDVDVGSQSIPAELLLQSGQDLLQRDAVQGVVGLAVHQIMTRLSRWMSSGVSM